jgi:hypothetical protein
VPFAVRVEQLVVLAHYGARVDSRCSTDELEATRWQR